MRLSKSGATLLGTVLIFGAGLAFVDAVLASLGSEVGGMFSSVRSLEEEWELSQKLEEKFNQVVENASQKRRVLRHLIEQRCDLRESAARYLTLCSSADLISLRTAYHLLDVAEEPIIAQHLLTLAEREVQETGQARQRLNQLRQELDRIQAEPHHSGPALPGI